jgi:hypothetical protein
MTLRTAALLACTVFLLGCGDAKPLAITDLRLDESHVPLPFVIALRNEGDSPVKIQGVSVNVTSKFLISRSQDRPPTGFDHQVEFDPNHPTQVKPNGDGVACGFLVWELPPDPPPMIAVVTCDFRVHADGETLVTEPIALVLQSQEGLLEAEGPLAEEQARKMVEALATTPGRKSAGFERLVERLQSGRWN